MAKLGDLYGRKGVFMASIVVFVAGSALTGLSQNMGELIGFRGVQGLGAGGLMVGAMAIIADLVPLRERGRYQGLMAAVMPLAFIGGPLLGGFLTDNFSWRWAFYINLPLGVLALIVVALTMHLPGRCAERVTIDWRGAGLLAAARGALTLLCSWGGSQYPWSSAPIIALGVVTAVALAAFVAVERRATEPVLPLMGGMLATSLLGGQLVTRTGRYRGLLLTGSVLMTARLALLATMNVATGQLTTSVYMIVPGVGMGLLMQTTMLVVQNSVAQRDVGVASGAATLFRTIGGSIGVSLLGTLFASRSTPRFLTGLAAPRPGLHSPPGCLKRYRHRCATPTRPRLPAASTRCSWAARRSQWSRSSSRRPSGRFRCAAASPPPDR